MAKGNKKQKNAPTNKRGNAGNTRQAVKNANVTFKGKIKWFDPKKGYGFILTEDGDEIFVHASGIVEGRTYIGLNDNDVVEFSLAKGAKGTLARNVVLLPDEVAVEVDDDDEETEEASEVETTEEVEEEAPADEDAAPDDEENTAEDSNDQAEEADDKSEASDDTPATEVEDDGENDDSPEE
jgi:CspA family cold shock protein